jgi:hypothetical protein
MLPSTLPFSMVLPLSMLPLVLPLSKLPLSTLPLVLPLSMVNLSMRLYQSYPGSVSDAAFFYDAHNFVMGYPFDSGALENS